MTIESAPESSLPVIPARIGGDVTDTETPTPIDVESLTATSPRDPTFVRSNGTVYVRDATRVPIPWEATKPAFGFSPTGNSWLPQPDDWGRYARDLQEGVPGGTLELYTVALRERRRYGLGARE